MISYSVIAHHAERLHYSCRHAVGLTSTKLFRYYDNLKIVVKVDIALVRQLMVSVAVQIISIAHHLQLCLQFMTN